MSEKISTEEVLTEMFEKDLQEAYDKADEITKHTLNSTTTDKSFTVEMNDLNRKYNELQLTLKNKFNLEPSNSLTPEKRQELEQDYMSALENIRKIYFERVFNKYHLPWWKRWSWKITKFFFPKRIEEILSTPAFIFQHPERIAPTHTPTRN